MEQMKELMLGVVNKNKGITMKNIFYFIIGILFYFPAHAENWMTEVDIDKQNRGIQGTIGHPHKKDCGSGCIDTAGHDLRYEEVKDVSVDDETKSNHRFPELSPDLSDCTDEVNCSQLAFICSESDVVPRWDLKSNWPNIPGSTSLNDTDLWFAWCEKFLGFDPKIIRAFVINTTMKDAADLADSKKDDLRNELKSERLILKTAVDNWDGYTQTQRMRVMKRMLRVMSGK